MPISICDDKRRGNILQRGHWGGVFGSELVGLDVVMQWWNQLTRMSLPFEMRWSL